MTKIHTWAPLEGRKAALQLDTGHYVDVTIKSILRGGRVSVLTDTEEQFSVSLSQLERPLSADVNERFRYFSDLSSLVVTKKLKSLFVTGEGGVGKSHTVNEILELEEMKDYEDLTDEDLEGKTPAEKHEAYDFVRIKGYTTARALYDTLEQHHDKVTVLDDCDSALTDVNSQNILKAALDTYDRRIVQWRTAKEQAQFEFTGSVIFLSNRNREKVPQSIISRSIVVDLEMTMDEKIERMGYILPTLTCVKTLETAEKFEVLKLIDKYKHTMADLNLRTLIKALVVYENTRNIELVRYQILNG